MRKKVLLTITAIALVAIGFIGGMLIQREFQLAQVHFAEEFIRDISGTSGPIQPAPAWNDWKYPDAKLKSKTGGASFRIMDSLVIPAGEFGIWITNDSYNDVVRYYAQKALFKDPDNLATRGGAGNQLSDGSLNAHLSDTRNGKDTGALRVKCLIRRSRSYDITVFISRYASEDATHIIVIYDPKTETKPNE